MSHYTNNLFDPKVKNNAWVHLFDYVPAGSRVLDVGCSSGNFGEVLIQEKHCEVVGIDIDKPDIAKAAKKLTRAEVRDIEHEDISDLGTFDVVIFADVLEHLLDPIGALNKVKKQLKKGGHIVFSIPNMAHISVRLQLMEGFFEYMSIGVLDRTHLHYYDELEVKHIFAAAGLAIQEVNPHTWSYPASRISERLLQMGLAIHDQDKLMKKLEDTKAFVWQFVGYALPSTEKLSVERPVHYSMPPEELHQTLLDRDDELQKLGERVREFETEKQAMEAEKKNLLEENARLARFYKQPFRGMAKRLKKRLRRDPSR